MKNTGKSLVTGALAGIANGLFGSGGGLFLVPLFTKWLGLEQRLGGDTARVQADATEVAPLI